MVDNFKDFQKDLSKKVYSLSVSFSLYKVYVEENLKNSLLEELIILKKCQSEILSLLNTDFSDLKEEQKSYLVEKKEEYLLECKNIEEYLNN